MKAFGLDIGATTIKAVYLEQHNAQPFFKSSIISITPVTGMLSDSSLDKEEMAQTIRKMVNSAKIPLKDANLALPDNQVYAKVIEMPLLSEKELENAIFWEAEQHIPVALSTVRLDWKVLRRDDKSVVSPKMLVLLVGAPAHVLQKYKEVFEYAGINIAGIEMEILSVMRAVMQNDTFPTSLILNIGSLGTSMAIVQNGVLVFLYSVPLGGTAMNRAIATEFSFTTEQAEEYKKVYGIDQNNFGGKIKQAVEPILLSLISEVKKSLSYYTDKYKGDYPITQIILSGGSAQLPGIIPLFVEEVGIETVIANPWKIHGIQQVPPELQERAAEYTIAVGLALKNL